MQSSAENKKDHGVIKIGSMKMTRAAAATLVSGLILSCIAAYTSTTGALVGIPMFLAFCIAAYNVNCASVGHCDIWAMFLACIYVLYAVVNLILLFAVGPEAMKKIKTAAAAARSRK